MPTPFPGMDPYLERHSLWEEVHTRLNVAMADALGPLLPAHYRVGVERRVYLAVLATDILVGRPDVLVASPPFAAPIMTTAAVTATVKPQVGQLPMPEEVVERYLEVRDTLTGQVITVIELLSPTNKLTREGREEYERKRLQVLRSQTNLVEIDLLRAGNPFPVHLSGDGNLGDYRVIVSRAPQRPRADVYAFGVREPIPDSPIPLRPGEAEPLLQLNRVLHDLYDRARYELEVDYRRPPDPPLRDDDASWASQLLQQAGLR